MAPELDSASREADWVALELDSAVVRAAAATSCVCLAIRGSEGKGGVGIFPPDSRGPTASKFSELLIRSNERTGRSGSSDNLFGV